MGSQKKSHTYIGWTLSALVALLLVGSAGAKLSGAASVLEQFTGKFGYSAETLTPIAITELVCLALYLFPRTAVLGAILLTGYLGGAIATHVRVHDNFAGPAIGGVLVWVALYLRDPRVRVIAPLTPPLRPTPPA